MIEDFKEDAEREIEKVRSDLRDAIKTNASTMLATIEKLRNENAELKQKLRQLLNEFPDATHEKYRFSGQEFITDTYQMFIWDVFRWKKKFEKLLKEVNGNEM